MPQATHNRKHYSSGYPIVWTGLIKMEIVPICLMLKFPQEKNKKYDEGRVDVWDEMEGWDGTTLAEHLTWNLRVELWFKSYSV